MSARPRTSSMEQHIPIQKRPRAGSISSRLRAASDLEEHGIIDKYQKGVFKDLIISGDSAMQSALEKYEQKGDMSDIQALIANSSGRRQSIDLLDGLDLDFLNVKKTFGGSFDGDLFFDELEGGGSEDPFSFSVDDGPGAARGAGLAAGGSAATGALPVSAARASLNSFSGGGVVEMSEYDAVAAALQNFQPQQGDFSYFGNRERMNSGSFSMDPAPGGGRERMGSFALDAGSGVGGRERLNSSNSLFEGIRGRFDSSGSIGSSSQVPSASQAMGGAGMRKDMGFHASNHVATAYGMSQPMQNSAFSDYFSDPPQYADGDGNEDGEGREKYVGIYSPEARRKRIEKFLEKRKRRVWTKKVKYDVRKNFADSRLRVKGRFVKKEDEETLRELLTI